MLKGNKHGLEKDRASIRTLELSHQKFKTTMINMPRTLMNTVDSMKEQMGNVSRQMEILRKNKKNAGDQKHYNRSEGCF